MRAVDTNVLIRLLVRDDQKQAAAAAAFIEQGAWLSHLTLAEVTWVLTAVYERRPMEVAAAIEMLLDHQQLVLQDPDVVAEALALFRARPSLGFSDCLMLEIARRAGHLPLGTFDRSLAKASGAHKL